MQQRQSKSGSGWYVAAIIWLVVCLFAAAVAISVDISLGISGVTGAILPVAALIVGVAPLIVVRSMNGRR